MKQVWMCDHCSFSSDNSEKVSSHEPLCSFNKANRKCYTCKFQYESGYGGEHIPGCELGLDIINGEEFGRCRGWVYEYLDEERDNKLNDLGI